MRFLNILFACVFLVFAGCSRVKPETDCWVQDAIETRLDKRVKWNQGCEEDLALEESMESLLQQKINPAIAVQVALLNNPSIQATFEQIGIAAADLVKAGLLQNPIFDAYVRFPNKSHLTLNTQFSIAKSFIDFFLMPLRKRSARIELEKAHVDVANSIFNLALDVQVTFYAYQEKLELLRLQKQLLEAAEIEYLLAKEQQNCGNIDSLFFQIKTAEFNQAKLEANALENQLISLREQLNTFMGLTNEGLNWTAEEQLEEELLSECYMEDLESLAKTQRLDLLAAKKETDLIASLGAQKKWWTYTNGQIGVSSEHEAEGFQETGPTLTLAIPIFDYGQADRAKLYAMWLQSCENLKALNVRIAAEVRESQNQLFKTKEIASNYRIILIPLFRKILNNSLLQYNAMAYGIYELINNKKQLIHAEMHYQSSLKDYWTAHAHLMRAVGGK